MSKRNREKRTIPNLVPTIKSRLKAEFQCTDEQIEMIVHAFDKMYPTDIITLFAQVTQRTYEVIEPSFFLDMEDGTAPQHMTLNHYPTNCLFDYLYKKYNADFAMLYGTAIIDPEPQQYLEMFPYFHNLFNSRREVQG